MGKEQKIQTSDCKWIRTWSSPHCVVPFFDCISAIRKESLSSYQYHWLNYQFTCPLEFLIMHSKSTIPQAPVPSMPPRHSTNQSSIRLATYTALSILSSWLLTAVTAISGFKKVHNKEETVAQQSNHVQSFASPCDWRPFNFNVLHGGHFRSKGADEDLCLSGWIKSWKVVVRPVTPPTSPKFPRNKKN